MAINFIAEIGSNHNQEWSRLEALIRKAKEIGCWGVKLQLFKADELFSEEFTRKIDAMKKWQLPREFVDPAIELCNELEIKIGFSVFDFDSLEFLSLTAASRPAVFLKIGSYEMLWTKFVKAVIDTRLPWMFSTGFSNTNDVYDVFRMGEEASNFPSVIFHCNSSYPAKPEDCCMDFIRQLSSLTFYSPTSSGWSDHTVSPLVLLQAVKAGARFIEFHFDLEDGIGHESSIGHCWSPSKIAYAMALSASIKNYHNHKLHCRLADDVKWMTDPEDGKRPLKKYREELLAAETKG